ncbi:MAG: response regulator [Candidatus Omnitrophica bacterium]|nr:response regulator [Candidatus Omnitrophota bacterium]MCF7894280.1 response regulator [Candidatus Omnitrophota bacterium]
MSKKILIVDDEPDILKIVIFRLKNKGYQTISATSGEEAFQLLGEDKPDLIILDLRMPGINGDEVCRRIKADNNLNKIPVILLTASTGHDIAGLAKDIGAVDFIRKPFDSQHFINKIENVL